MPSLFDFTSKATGQSFLILFAVPHYNNIHACLIYTCFLEYQHSLVIVFFFQFYGLLSHEPSAMLTTALKSVLFFGLSESSILSLEVSNAFSSGLHWRSLREVFMSGAF